MKCLDRNLTNRQVFERVDKYSRGELTSKQTETFEKHFWKCSSCYEALILHRLTLKVVKEYGNQIFPEAEKSKIKEKTISPLRLMKDGKEIDNIPIEGPTLSWSVELFKTGLYAIIYFIGRKKQLLWQKKVDTIGNRRKLFGEKLYSPSQPETQKLHIPAQEKQKPKEFILSLEQKEEGFILSLTRKKNTAP